jgi:Holliday junction resolvase-like predicted endonuclease
MNTEEILEQLSEDEIDRSGCTDLSISTKVIPVPSRNLMAVGGDQTEMVQIGAYFDALLWNEFCDSGEEPLTLVVGYGERTPDVLSALALLNAANPTSPIQVQVDFEPVSLPVPELDGMSAQRLQQFADRDTAILPKLAREIESRVNDPCFTWSRTLSGKKWSGRVDGLQICTLSDEGEGVIRLGNTKRASGRKPEHKMIRDLLDADERQFGKNDAISASKVIKCLAVDRRQGILSTIQPEHLLESRICRGALGLECLGFPLDPVQTQFPAAWSETKQAKYIDLLMSAGKVPWVIELKVARSGQGKEYRKAVAQAVLYREYIRWAKGLHHWFRDRDMDATQCRSAVAFPLKGNPQYRQGIRQKIQFLADLFSVEVVIIPDNWNESEA